MKPSHHSRQVARTLANLGVAMTEIDFVPNSRFSYRRNIDGTTDSICMSCYLTAATGLTSDELMQRELSHLNECLGTHYAHQVISTSMKRQGPADGVARTAQTILRVAAFKIGITTNLQYALFA